MSLMFIVYVCLVFVLLFISGYISFFLVKRMFLNAEERSKLPNHTGIYSILLTLIPIIGIFYLSPRYFLKKMKVAKAFTTSVGLGLYTLFVVVTTLLLMFSKGFIVTSLISPMKIIGSAMSPTLHDGGFYTNLQPYMSIARGDIVFYKIEGISTGSRASRIVGLPNETIGFVGGKVYLVSNTGSRAMLDESYLPYGTQTFMLGESKEGEFKIPPDSYFLMGDNRANSSDSRSCFTAGCDYSNKNHFLIQDNILGKIY